MDYISLEKELIQLSEVDKISFCSLSKTALNRNIYCVRNKNEKAPKVLLVGAIHAREYITCDLIVEMFKTSFLNSKIDIWAVPLSNPDGVELCLKGLKSVPKNMRSSLVKINNGTDFSLWKANAFGVDLNNNFDAGWGRKFNRKTSPASSGFYGEYPVSETETRSIVKLISKVKFDLVISFHTKGEEIYFDYFNKNYERDESVAQIFSKDLNYEIKSSQDISSGGLKDWCVQRGICALTIECGEDSLTHPIKEDKLPELLEKFKNFDKSLEKALILL